MADDANAGAKPKPAMDIYTAMLILAFVAISIGCVILALDLTRYRNPQTGAIEIVPPADLRVETAS